MPPDLFLLGCVFFIIECDQELKRYPNLTTIIRKYGGEVEDIYSPKVTHVVCKTQRHGTVMQVSITMPQKSAKGKFLPLKFKNLTCYNLSLLISKLLIMK